MTAEPSDKPSAKQAGPTDKNQPGAFQSQRAQGGLPQWMLAISLLLNLILGSFVVTQSVQARLSAGRVDISEPERSSETSTSDARPLNDRREAKGGSRGGPGGGPRGPRGDDGMRTLRGLANLDSLSAEQRKMVRERIELRLPDLREKSFNARQASYAYRAVIDQADFDPETIREASKRLIEARSNQQKAIHEAMIDALSVLPPEARETLREARQDHEDRRGRRRRNTRRDRR